MTLLHFLSKRDLQIAVLLCSKFRNIGEVRSTDSVHQLGEGTGGVPAAPLPVQRRQEVLKGANAPGSGPGAGPALRRRPGAAGRDRVWGRGPIARRTRTGVTVAQEALSLLQERQKMQVSKKMSSVGSR